MINIDNLITDAIKSKKELEKKVYRLIKTRIMEYKTAEHAKPYTEDAELILLTKMVTERKDAADMYTKAGHLDKAEAELAEATVIEQFLPKPLTEADINKYIDKYVEDNGALTAKSIGAIMKIIKADHPAADGKLISKLIKSRI